MALGYGIDGEGCRVFSSWENMGKAEKKRLEKFELIKGYEDFYLCGRYDENHNLLYRECFARFDIDGPTRVVEKPRYIKAAGIKG